MSYAELSCAIPKAGGAFVYANRALGSELGYLTGCAQCIEFIFAPPAIAAAIGAYFHLFMPQIPSMAIAVVAYLIFTALNILGTKQSAIFELFITVIAVFELFLFAGIAAPHFTWEAFSRNPLPKGWMGVLPAIPYAIWFYLAIEGIANVAEETKNPKKDLVMGFGSAILTLVILALLTFFTSVGVGGWEAIVYTPGSLVPSDSPLPLALKAIVGENHVFYHLLIGIGLCGLLASFHGIILVAGRATFEFGRIGYAPKSLGTLHRTRNTPSVALLVNLVLGVLALLTGKTGEIITISVFGALTLYVLSMVSLFRLRKSEPRLSRPFLAPGYPFVPAIALLLSLFCLIAMAYYQPLLGLIYLGLLGVCFFWFYMGLSAETRKRAIS
jgi:ethanolamine permease